MHFRYRRLRLTAYAGLLLGAVPGLAAQTLPQSVDDVVLPPGYAIELVASGLTYPTGMSFGPDGSLFIAESGYSYGATWAEARVVRWSPQGRMGLVASGFRAPIMGVTYHDDRLYIAHRGMVSSIDLGTVDRSRRLRHLVQGLPVVPNGQHFNGPVAFGGDGKMYFGVGAVTNSGVPGADDGLYGWLFDFPWMRDAPDRAVTLRGERYPQPDIIGADKLKPVSGSAYMPFGTAAEPGRAVPAHPRPSGAVYRANADGTGLEAVAGGIRSPFGTAFGPDGQLYLIDHGIDDKGARPAANVPDHLFRIRPGAWYGWPDFIGGKPITDPEFDPVFPLGRRPALALQSPPAPEPPVVRFPPHSAVTGIAWSPAGAAFGFGGSLFAAEFGDGSPFTTGLRPSDPKGFRVSRVDVGSGAVEPFLTIRNPGLAETRGPKRPIDVRFDPAGENLYLLDFGQLELKLSLGETVIRPVPQSGALWRIRRVERAGGTAPAARFDGGRPLSEETSRVPLLLIRQTQRVAAAHALRAQTTPIGLQRTRHRERAREELRTIETLAGLALRRIDEPGVLDAGTRMLLLRVRDWAADAEPLTLVSNDPMIAEVEAWLARHDFPEREELYRNYALPGRWQTPPEASVR